jgi:hypothetical protein
MKYSKIGNDAFSEIEANAELISTVSICASESFKNSNKKSRFAESSIKGFKDFFDS